MDQSPHIADQVKIFRSVFRGREDVFAIRWEKGSKSGYMPAYHYDPYMFRLHKNKGGSFQNYSDKSLLPLSDEQIMKHLQGEQFIGIYPNFDIDAATHGHVCGTSNAYRGAGVGQCRRRSRQQ